MKKFIGFFICSLCLALLSLPGFPQAGTLDSTFSSDGMTWFSLSDGSNDAAFDVVALPDTTLLVCGRLTDGVYAGFIMRVLNDGEQDTAFGTNGLVEIQYGDFGTEARRLIVLPNNKIVVSGHARITGTDDREFFIARFLPDGLPDLTFNSTGHWVSSYGSGLETHYDMIMQADGKFIMAGQTGDGTNLLFMRVNANGTIDNSFGTNGYTAISISTSTNEYVAEVDVLSNGTIAGVGCYEYTAGNYKFILVKLTPQGNPMPGFGTNGIITPPQFNDYITCRPSGFVVRNDSLLVGGYLKESINKAFLTKLDSSGNAATGFGTNGITIPDIGFHHYGNDIFRQPDGKLYLCGWVSNSGESITLWRFRADGNLDYSFNNNGYVITSQNNFIDRANSIDLQPDGKIVLAGTTSVLDPWYKDKISLIRYLNDWAPPGCFADFAADPLLTCEGGQVSFTDQTVSTDSIAITWQWSFEGGTPAVSSVQNPVITYNNDGVFNVQLIVSDGIYTDTLLRTDYITVEAIPVAPVAPTGPVSLCGTHSYNYSTLSVTYADGYNWQVNPAEAGMITGTDTTAVFVASATWTGSCTIQVNAENQCGTGPWSNALAVDLHPNPVFYELSGTGEGGFCEGDPGSELTLGGSDIDVEYELYMDGSGTGNIVTGTGSPISFGLINITGLYTAYGYTDFCSGFMVGQVYVHQWDTPGEAETPVGPEETCENESTLYTTEEIEEADWYVWTLDPAEAGMLAIADDSVTITWNSGFSGIALLSVHGENDCGIGPESDSLGIHISLSPDPQISGPQVVNTGSEEPYQTAENPENTYSWEVTGGTITSGAGTHEVMILWGAPGEGLLTVTEETAGGCSETTPPYIVTIDESIFMEENQQDRMLVYPNPFNDRCIICVEQTEGSYVTIEVTDILGRQVDWIYEGYLGSGSHRFEWKSPGNAESLYFLKALSNAEFRVIKLMHH